MEQLIIVSNRLPFRIDKKGSDYEVKQSSGGLVSALQCVYPVNRSVSWVGIADFKKDVWKSVKDSVGKSSQYDLQPLFADKKLYHLYYNDFSNAVIWPLFHYFPSLAEYNEKAFDAYRSIDNEFASKIIEMANRGATVWIHDYHLMLLPKMIKEARPDLNIGFFLHIPFPSYEILKLIPAGWRNEILEGLLSSDVLGFHTREYVSHFKHSLAYFFGIETYKDKAIFKSHICHIKPYPISIDFKKFHDAFDLPLVKRGRSAIREKHKGLKVIFSVDRLDYTKGVINRLQAYELLLEEHPEQREKVVFIMNVVPSRDQMSRYAERKKMIEENVGRINGLYGNMQWQPVIYQYRHLTFNQLLAFYTVADIVLITPLRDGMNLVAKEFIASRKDKRGMLILSEFAGAASELKGAILVNPNDIQTVKNGIHSALNVDDPEQMSKMNEMQNVLKENDIEKWTNSFLADITKAKIINKPMQPHVMTFDEKTQLIDSYRHAKKRLLLLDYDGTLVPYFNKPEEASPGHNLKQLLSELNSNEENEVVLVSGRDAGTLEKWFSGTGVSYVAEHGALFKRPDSEWISFAGNCEVWKNEVINLFEKYAAIYNGCFVEKKRYSVAFHYRTVDLKREEELKSNLRKELLMLDSNNDFNVLHGNMVIEVKSTGVDKGHFVSGILGDNNFDFVLAMGDDTTDEDMFTVLSDKSHYYTIKVGLTPTKAKCNLFNVNNVISFLDQLNKYKNINYLKRSQA